MSMRKIHSASMAKILKNELNGLTPSFKLASPLKARKFDAQKKMTFFAQFSNGKGYLIYLPSSSARDDYFSLDIAWVKNEFIDLESLFPIYFIKNGQTLDSLSNDGSIRCSLSCILAKKCYGYDGSFKFSTASSRVSILSFQKSKDSPEIDEDALLDSIKKSWLEEDNLTEEEAANEVKPAIDSSLKIINEFVIPFFISQNEAI